MSRAYTIKDDYKHSRTLWQKWNNYYLDTTQITDPSLRAWLPGEHWRQRLRQFEKTHFGSRKAGVRVQPRYWFPESATWYSTNFEPRYRDGLKRPRKEENIDERKDESTVERKEGDARETKEAVSQRPPIRSRANPQQFQHQQGGHSTATTEPYPTPSAHAGGSSQPSRPTPSQAQTKSSQRG